MKSKYLFLVQFFNDFDQFSKLKAQNGKTEKKKTTTNMYDKPSELYNDLIAICFNECNDLSVATRKKINPKYNPDNLRLDRYEYENWYEEESNDSKIKNEEKELHNLPPMPPLEEHGLKVLTSNKLLTRLLFLAQIKAGAISSVST